MVTKLATVLQEKSATARWQAIARLNKTAEAKLDDAAIVASLIEALADEHAFVRWQAGLALAGQTQGRQKLLDFLKNYSTTLSGTTTQQSKTDLICASAIDALVESRSIEARGYLTSFLLAGNSTLRQSAAEALSKLGYAEAVPYLINTLKDSNPWVRRAATLALGHIGDVSAVEALIQCLQDKAVIVRRSAVYALGALRSEIALPALKISLTDQDPQVRRNAAWALGRIGQPEAIMALTRLLDDVGLNGAIAAAANEAITTLTKPSRRWQQFVPIWVSNWGGKRLAR